MKKVVQITVTEKCNLRCIYCYEKFRDNSVMDLDLAKQIITKSFQDYADADLIEFDFHGGEVALVFDFICDVCNWTWEHDWNKQYLFHATTNGTLIHGHIQDWFKKNAHRFNLGLSLDGNKGMHDVNRCNSYDNIDLRFFLETYPHQPVKMTISPLSLSSLFCGIIDIYEKGFDVSANLAYGMAWEDKQLKTIYYNELAKLADWYLQHPEQNVCSLLQDRGFYYIGKAISCKKSLQHRKWCGTGENMKCYSVKGEESPCQMFNPSSNRYGKKLTSKTNICQVDIDDVCASCPILPVCPTCYGGNFVRRQELTKRPDELCDYRKIESLVSSYLYANMFISNTRYKEIEKYKGYDKAYSLLGIKYIQDNIILDINNELADHIEQ